jgi:hypothetical protein
MIKKIIKAPTRPYIHKDLVRIFLAGSIEEGTADDWQQTIIDSLVGVSPVVILNPRRDNWDASIKQDINNPIFYEQVTWELDMLESADIIVVYFDPTTKSPISLLELGLFADDIDKFIICCCPDGFWRKGNVDIVCQRCGIPVFTNLETLLVELKVRIESIKTEI